TTRTAYDMPACLVSGRPPLRASDSTTGEIDAANTIALSISDAKHDSDDTLGTVTISGVPSGWSLSAGSDQGGGVWTEAVADLGSDRKSVGEGNRVGVGGRAGGG